jgi:hypothetical protein
MIDVDNRQVLMMRTNDEKVVADLLKSWIG